MRNKSVNSANKNEISGNTIINFGPFRDNPMTLTDIVRRNNESELNWLLYVGVIMPVAKRDKRIKDIKKDIVRYLKSQGLFKEYFSKKKASAEM